LPVVQPPLDEVPEAHREKVAGALVAAFGPGAATAVRAAPGGASGALTFRVVTDGGDFLLRLETLSGPMRNPHQYACMRIAADAGIAPPIRYLDEGAGVLVLPFLDVQPLETFPGGPVALAAEGGALLRRLHDTTPFPSHGDHMENLARLLAALPASGRVAGGLLDEHTEGFARIRAAYPWDPSSFVSAHNDPNQFNVLYDGERLWLIDWETASRNDPFLDIATMGTYLAPSPELRTVLLRAELGREPSEVDVARYTVMSLLVRLFAGSILLMIIQDPAGSVHTDLTSMTPEAFAAAIGSGDLVAGQPVTTLAFAKMSLRGFLDGMASPEAQRALDVLG
jgi:aminoglycoside phosphotransferase (APT) family kinase protein